MQNSTKEKCKILKETIPGYITWSTGSRCWWTQGVPPGEMSNPRSKMYRARQEERGLGGDVERDVLRDG